MKSALRDTLSRAVGLVLLCTGCGDSQPAGQPRPAAEGAPPSAGTNASTCPQFVDATGRTGIGFHHQNGATPRKFAIETMGGGLAVIDFDGDGKQDLYFVNSGAVPTKSSEQAPGSNRLYRNLGDWKFEDVSAQAQASGRGYMMGAVVGDYDNDGHPDLYVTSYGSNTLYRNRGDGTFEDVTGAAGCDDTRWSTGAAFLDYDDDGDLDLFVQNYVDWTIEGHHTHEISGMALYPPPDVFDEIESSLFRNRGDGTFEDVSEAAGIAGHPGKGLGVLTADFDDDGDVDIYCANDAAPNFLFENKGDGTFREVGAFSGAAFSEEGREESGMGVDAEDLDGDGLLDIVVTNFSGEPNAIYRGEGKLFFTEVGARSGTWEASVPALGFGVRLADLDGDGIVDLAIANGHVYDNAELVLPPATYRQSPLLYRGLGDTRFEDCTPAQPAAFRAPKAARALATADLDDDGDLDLVFGVLGAAPQIFDNTSGAARSWTSVRLVGTRGDSTALGARVTVEAGGRTQFREIRSGGSYLSQSDLRAAFGLGDAKVIDVLRVRWPDGSVEEARDVPVRRHLVFVEKSGLQR